MNKIKYEEIEVKLYIEDLAGLENKLKETGAKLIQERTHEFNLRYDKPDGELRARSHVLRLRQDQDARITFKGPSEEDSGAVRREEIEIVVADFEAANKLLQALGYETVVIYEKYRTTYKLGSELWMLDELPMSNVVEIEGQNGEQIQAAAERLGLDWERRVTVGYLDLFARVKKTLGLDFRDLTFENFEGLAVRAQDLGVLPADGAIN